MKVGNGRLSGEVNPLGAEVPACRWVPSPLMAGGGSWGTLGNWEGGYSCEMGELVWKLGDSWLVAEVVFPPPNVVPHCRVLNW